MSVFQSSIDPLVVLVLSLDALPLSLKGESSFLDFGFKNTLTAILYSVY